jgi:hypothetical protein
MNTIHRNFNQVADAESARSALLAGGFSAASVKLNSHEDAPPVDTGTAAVSNVFDSITPGGAAAAAKARQRAGALLSVDADDEDQEQQAHTIMQRFGGSEA